MSVNLNNTELALVITCGVLGLMLILVICYHYLVYNNSPESHMRNIRRMDSHDQLRLFNSFKGYLSVEKNMKQGLKKITSRKNNNIDYMDQLIR